MPTSSSWRLPSPPPLVGAVAQATDRIRRVIVIGDAGEGQESWADLVTEDRGDFQAPDVPEDTTCLIMYTSGTTGRPKGAMLDHGNLFAQALTLLRVNETFDESDVAFMTAPLFHIAGLGSISPNFVIGIPTVIHPLGAFNAGELLDAWERERATIVFNVPQQWQVIFADPSIPTRDLHLRIISWGAAPASDTLLHAMADRFPHAMNVAVFGQTEMSPITCALRGEDSLRKEGFVWVVDRKKDMIISGGENVYCAEVENVLAGHPRVLEAAIYGRADERWGEVPVAAVALRPEQELTIDELQEWLSDKLARFKQPKALVVLPALPRNAAGKVNKVALRAADRELSPA